MLAYPGQTKIRQRRKPLAATRKPLIFPLLDKPKVAPRGGGVCGDVEQALAVPRVAHHGVRLFLLVWRQTQVRREPPQRGSAWPPPPKQSGLKQSPIIGRCVFLLADAQLHPDFFTARPSVRCCSYWSTPNPKNVTKLLMAKSHL